MAAGFTITERVCACGCDTRMPSTLVNRGWKYLRRHKPAVPRERAGVAVSGKAPRTAAHTYSYADAIRLADVEIPGLVEQMAAAEAEIDAKSEALNGMAKRLERLQGIRNLALALQGNPAEVTA